ncbi:MAG: hypothetical protein AAF629_36800, partial [Chloroflexota bacterium]
IERIVDTNPKPERRAIKSLFTPISSRIVRALLDKPSHTWQLTELANTTGASVGQVYNVSKKLTSEGFAHKTGRGSLTLTEPTNLLEAWRDQYQPSANQVHRFQLVAQSLADSLRQIYSAPGIDTKQILGTAHTGFQLLANEATTTPADDIRLYATHHQIKTLVEVLSLQPSNYSGNLHLIVPYDEGVFYQPTQTSVWPVVNDIQLYLDLYHDSLVESHLTETFRRQHLQF